MLKMIPSRIIVLMSLFIFSQCHSQERDYESIKVISKTEKLDLDKVKMVNYYNHRFALVFPTSIEINNLSNKKKYLWNIGYQTATTEKNGAYSYIYKNNGEHYMKNSEIPILEANSTLKYNVLMRIAIDSSQAKTILDYYGNLSYPKSTDSLYLTTYKKFVESLKKIKKSENSNLYNNLFKDIEFSFTFSNELTNKPGFTVYYDWLNGKTYHKYKKATIPYKKY